MTTNMLVPLLVFSLACSKPLLTKPTPGPTPVPSPVPTAVPYANKGLSESAVLMYLGSWEGSQGFACTATSIRQATMFKKGRFLTAAHCVTTNDETGKLKETDMHISLSPEAVGDETKFTRASVEFLGNQDEGYDFAILESTLSVPAIELGSEKDEAAGSEVFAFAGSLGMGIALTRGQIARLAVDRPLVNTENHIHWEGNVLMLLPVAPGGSGSAVVSKRTNKIIGIVLGGNSTYTLALPISRVLEVLDTAEKAKSAK